MKKGISKLNRAESAGKRSRTLPEPKELWQETAEGRYLRKVVRLVDLELQTKIKRRGGGEPGDPLPQRPQEVDAPLIRGKGRLCVPVFRRAGGAPRESGSPGKIPAEKIEKISAKEQEEKTPYFLRHKLKQIP